MKITRERAAPATSDKRCAGCASSFREREWQALAVSRRIEACEVARLVAGWPDHVCIEVRLCSNCGRPIAAKRAV